jgi:hypothetical protein
LYKSFPRSRRVHLLGLIPLFGAAMLAATAVAQSTSQNNPKLPPNPTIDVNVNQNETLTEVHYDNKYEVYGGAGFRHFMAGPQLAAGANLGGFDVRGTWWWKKRLGPTVSVRGYYGTQGVNPNPYRVTGPFVFEHMFMGGGTYRLLSGEHALLSAHVLAGGADGVFDHALGRAPLTGVAVQPRDVGLYQSGMTFASAVGGSLDLNRSPRLALRISPEWIYTRYGGYGTPSNVPSKLVTQSQSEFGISVGIVYRLRMGKGPRLR